MTAQRSTKEEFDYAKYLKTKGGTDCPFCNMNTGHPQFVLETDNLKVLRNRTPYSLWDSQGVIDHLMIVPKVHTAKLGDLDAKAAAELIALIGTYEIDGYNIYARAVTSTTRSVVHQHTHLIKLDGKKRTFLFMLRRPWYFRISK